MLLALDIDSFALIDHLYIEFDAGLNVITGETGAGKSIVVDSINFILGSKFSKDVIKKGEDKTEVKAMFSLSDAQLQYADRLGYKCEDSVVSVSRSFNLSSKSTCRFNNKIITLTALRELASAFMEVHGQHENQALFHKNNHIIFLDSYSLRKSSKEKETFNMDFKAFKALRSEIIDNNLDGKRILARMEEIKEEIKEFAVLKWKQGDETRLKARVEEMENAEKISSAVNEAFEVLYEADDSAITLMKRSTQALEQIKDIHSKYSAIYDRIASIYYDLEDAVDGLRNHVSEFDGGQDKLPAMQEKLFAFSRLKKKYSMDEQELLEYMSGLKDEYSNLEYNLSHAKELKAKLKELYTSAIASAKKLSDWRKLQGKNMEMEIMSHLDDLGMKNARFQVSLTDKELGSTGIDEVEFLFCANKGQDLKPLTKVASGGEISRLMLALKNVELNSSPVSAMVFDEIDTGISGKMAQAVAMKLANIARTKQVICITHQPQVCAMGDVNIIVVKSEDETGTQVSTIRLEEDGKIQEIARLISGSDITESGISHAGELIRECEKYKHSS